MDIEPGQSKRIADLTDFHDIDKLGAFLVARMGDQIATHLLWSEKYLYLPEAEIRAVKTDQTITLSSAKFVKEVELLIEDTSGAVFSDNYFNLIPGVPLTIKILSLPEGSKTLRIKGVNSSVTKVIL